MVGLGLLMLLLGLWGAWARWRDELFRSKLFLRFAVLMGPAGLIAHPGRMAHHRDRPPALGGLWRDADEGRGIEPLGARTFELTLIVFIVMYLAVFGTGISYMLKLVAKGPAAVWRASARAEPRSGRPARPLSAVADRIDPAIEWPSRQEEMSTMGIDLPVIWAVIIGFGLMMYVVMDGFDLGIGILFPFIRDRDDRDTMVNTVAPVWDGNETWLVLGGAALMAAFPLAYSVLLSALYMPLVLMLAGLIWRGVAFEFRFKADEAHRPFWDKAFAWGSYIATFSQGVALGAFINGFKVTGASYDGGSFDWLSPFSLFTGVGLIVAYALLGCTWLIMKTEGELQHRMKALARPVTLVLVAAIVIVSVWTPLAHPEHRRTVVLTAEHHHLLAGAGACRSRRLGPCCACFGTRRTHRRSCSRCSCCSWAIAVSRISLWPNIIPPAISIREAAAPPESMGFTLVGALFIIPFILAYTAWSYYVFRGKVRAGEGYH